MSEPKVARLWHGWTTPANADVYEALLRNRIFPDIEAMAVPGYRSIDLFRRELDSGEVEFATLMTFDSLDAVKRFAGEDHEKAHVPPEAREVLARFEERSRHFEIRERRRYDNSR